VQSPQRCGNIRADPAEPHTVSSSSCRRLSRASLIYQGASSLCRLAIEASTMDTLFDCPALYAEGLQDYSGFHAFQCIAMFTTPITHRFLAMVLSLRTQTHRNYTSKASHYVQFTISRRLVALILPSCPVIPVAAEYFLITQASRPSESQSATLVRCTNTYLARPPLLLFSLSKLEHSCLPTHTRLLLKSEETSH
jgi:hypothetical protein